MNNEFIISDLHFFHGNMVKFCGRPYNIDGNNLRKNADELRRMNEDILTLFDKLPEECTIYNLGDVFFAGKSKSNIDFFYNEGYNEIVDMTQRMSNNGRRKLILILGNHDELTEVDDKTSNRFYERLGFDEVVEEYSLDVDKYHLLMTHRPHNPVDGILDGNIYNLYGHTHEKAINKYYFTYDDVDMHLSDNVVGEHPNLIVDTNRYINCCLDYNHKILNMEDIINGIKRRENA